MYAFLFYILIALEMLLLFYLWPDPEAFQPDASGDADRALCFADKAGIIGNA